MRELIELAKQHQAADDYVRGTYGGIGKDGVFRGCSLGCTIYDYNKVHGTNINYADHEALAKALRVPEFLIHLQDLFFEKTSEEVFRTWSVDFLEALHSAEGKDLALVQPKFLLFILKDNGSSAVDQVRAVLQNWIETGTIDKDAAKAARAEAMEADSAAWTEAMELDSAARAADAAREARVVVRVADAILWEAWKEWEARSAMSSAIAAIAWGAARTARVTVEVAAEAAVEAAAEAAAEVARVAREARVADSAAWEAMTTVMTEDAREAWVAADTISADAARESRVVYAVAREAAMEVARVADAAAREAAMEAYSDMAKELLRLIRE